MEVTPTALPEVLLIEPRVFEDARGFFKETWESRRYTAAGIPDFVQDNCSRSCRGTLRGLHYQIQHPQGKLVQVFKGEIFDVAVDLRKNSPNFGKWTGARLSETNHRQLYVPPGFAHGFCVLSDVADVFYKCTDIYAPQHERTLAWNDPTVGVEWPLDIEPILSAKDQQGQVLAECDVYSG
ncbi:MAG: dTDP-4-dehydrorhamnose 3,5-epimerase [Planctomycetaceae bacterium]|nr:dTDP-4-dehydrorhamnose 3,5-epimerase [Planctomycetaceae bacterium]